MRRGLRIVLALALLVTSVASNATIARATGTVYINGPVSVDKTNPIQGELVGAQVTLVNVTGRTFSAKIWGIGGRGPRGWEVDIQDCGFVPDYSLSSGLNQTMTCQIVARDVGTYTLFAVYQDYGGGWHEVFDSSGASRKGYFTVKAAPAPPPDRNSLPVTASPQVGSYFRLPKAIQVFQGPDGAFQNNLSGNLVVKIKGGPQRGAYNRIWWDLSEEEWSGGTGWFTLDEIPASTPKPAPPVSTPNPAPRAPTPPQSAVQSYCYQVSGLSYPDKLSAGQQASATLTLTNCGGAWDHDFLLGTWAPRDSDGVLRSPSWVSNNRAMRIPDGIGSGQSVQVSIPIQAPATNGVYTQNLRVVAEWREWLMNGSTISINVQVSGGQNPAPITPPSSNGAGRTVEVQNGNFSGLNIRGGPGTGYAINCFAANGTRLTVTDGPIYSDGYTWWYVQGIPCSGWAAGFALVNVQPIAGISDEELHRMYVRYFYEHGRLDFPPLPFPSGNGLAMSYLSAAVRQDYLVHVLPTDGLSRDELAGLFLYLNDETANLRETKNLAEWLPFIGNYLSFTEALTGADLVTQEKLDNWDRSISLALGLAPFVPEGSLIRYGVKGVKELRHVSSGEVKQAAESLGLKQLIKEGKLRVRLTEPDPSKAIPGGTSRYLLYFDANNLQVATAHELYRADGSAVGHLHFKDVVLPNGLKLVEKQAH